MIDRANDVVLDEGVPADDQVGAQAQRAEAGDKALEIVAAPQIEARAGLGDQQPPVRAVLLGEGGKEE